MEKRDATVPGWSFVRDQIRQMLLGHIPEHKRDLLEVVEIIQAQCPDCTWLEVAAWMGNVKTPTLLQQRVLWQWVVARDDERNG